MDNQSGHTSQFEKTTQSKQIPWWVKSICIVIAVGAVAYKFVIGDFNLDFNAFLSLILALFSIFLSAEFYFKATDTSNRFYDNIYKFTKDIAELLSRIEASFGQQLKSIDERQSKMNDWVYNGKMSEQEIEKTESEINKQHEELDRIRVEQQKIIEKLIEDAKIKEEEKERIKMELAKNKKQYLQTRNALNNLQAKLISNEEIDEITSIGPSFNENINVKNYSKKFIMQEIGISSLVPSVIVSKFNKLKYILSDDYINALERLGYAHNGKLTLTGIQFYQNIIRELRYHSVNRVDVDDKI